MNILVTGGTGLLGKSLAQRLSQKGYHVTLLMGNDLLDKNGKLSKHGKRTKTKDFDVAGQKNNEEGSKGNFRYDKDQDQATVDHPMGHDHEHKGEIRYLSCSLDDREQVLDACQRQDYVFHCDELCSSWGKYRDFYAQNVLGTQYIIEGCRQHNVKRLIHVSSPSIYFNYTHRLYISENEPLPKRPVNAYAKTKLLAEQSIDQAFVQGLPVITIRPKTIFGPSCDTVLARLISLNRSRIPIIEGGKIVVDFTYVDNVVDALLLCMAAPEETLGKKYNISNGESLYLYDLLERVFKELDERLNTKPVSYAEAYILAGFTELANKTFLKKRPPFTRYCVGMISKSQTLNITAAKRELGYEPRVSMDQGIKAFTKWWKKMNHH
ncbi:NAD-dependent epimerase/dehydratase family protein [Caldalkalibacillus salinus]|uniref:NAD-dependent epimerase/dehydratase family protein n=1 Tax=Caldalkalibacillus salinus TaxID=2803787 RepID=UPI0019244AE8|nr:NAD-dependent epimerase/dehydratase family protein [Caldalkalibacillus salinus]